MFFFKVFLGFFFFLRGFFGVFLGFIFLFLNHYFFLPKTSTHVHPCKGMCILLDLKERNWIYNHVHTFVYVCMHVVYVFDLVVRNLIKVSSECAYT